MVSAGEDNVLGACGEIIIIVAVVFARLIHDDENLGGLLADVEGFCLAVFQIEQPSAGHVVDDRVKAFVILDIDLHLHQTAYEGFGSLNG
jgi:hypothetical protein